MYEISIIGKFIETGSRLEVTRGGDERGPGSHCLTVTVSVWSDGRVKEIVSSEGCATSCM